jgi:hypothetical protein
VPAIGIEERMNPKQQPDVTARIAAAERLAADARKMQDAAERERLIDEQWAIFDKLERDAAKAEG